MRELYQTLKHLVKSLPRTNLEIIMLKCPEFLIKPAMDKTPAGSGKGICFMDYYQQYQMNLLKKIEIKAYSYHSELK